MPEILYVFGSTIEITASCFRWVLLIGMVLSFFPISDDNVICNFIFGITDVITYPVRRIIAHFDFFANSPIDFAAIISYYLLWLIGSLC